MRQDYLRLDLGTNICHHLCRLLPSSGSYFHRLRGGDIRATLLRLSTSCGAVPRPPESDPVKRFHRQPWGHPDKTRSNFGSTCGQGNKRHAMRWKCAPSITTDSTTMSIHSALTAFDSGSYQEMHCHERLSLPTARLLKLYGSTEVCLLYTSPSPRD